MCINCAQQGDASLLSGTHVHKLRTTRRRFSTLRDTCAYIAHNKETLLYSQGHMCINCAQQGDASLLSGTHVRTLHTTRRRFSTLRDTCAYTAHNKETLLYSQGNIERTVCMWREAHPVSIEYCIGTCSWALTQIFRLSHIKFHLMFSNTRLCLLSPCTFASLRSCYTSHNNKVHN
jgi:hypothetical protein